MVERNKADDALLAPRDPNTTLRQKDIGDPRPDLVIGVNAPQKRQRIVARGQIKIAYLGGVCSHSVADRQTFDHGEIDGFARNNGYPSMRARFAAPDDHLHPVLRSQRHALLQGNGMAGEQV
jgi:hypothetical protein